MIKKIPAALLAGIILLGGSYTFAGQSAFAHTFSGDESATFLATMEIVKTRLSVAEENAGTNSSIAAAQVDEAKGHLTDDIIKEISERNERLGKDIPDSIDQLQSTLETGNATREDVSQQVSDINGLLGEAVSARIDAQQRNNATVQGLMLADLIDEVLESYDTAFGADGEGMNMSSMDSMAMNDNTTSTSASMDMAGGDEITDEQYDNYTIFELTEKYPDLMGDNQTGGNNGGNETSFDEASYQFSLALATHAQDLFQTDLKKLGDANATAAINNLEAGLQELKQAIQDKASPDDVAAIVHGKVHPNIQTAYKLQVVPEFPLPVLAGIVGIVGVLAYSRIRGKRLP